jgi:hypothetical protein
LAQVLFEDQPICGDFVGSDIFQACIEFIQTRNQRLIPARRTERFLQAEGSTMRLAATRASRLLNTV